MAFKPLIDYINDQLSMEMIVYDEEEKAMGGNTYIQNIETVNGSASQQNSGVINTYNTTNDTHRKSVHCRQLKRKTTIDLLHI